MKKLHALRAFLAQAMPEYTTDPQRLKVFADQGTLVAKGTASLAFAYRYTGTLVLLDFTGDVDKVAVPVLAWLSKHQPDLALSKEQRERAVRFEAEFIDAKTIDLVIKVDLVENVAVHEDEVDGQRRLRTVHLGEVTPAAPGSGTTWVVAGPY